VTPVDRIHAGYVVWDEKYSLTYRGHIYDTEERARQVMAGIVWHSRERYIVRPVSVEMASHVG
jgi:hypothetical protein